MSRSLATFDVGRDLAVPAVDAWRLLTDTRTWPSWGPSLREVKLHPAVIRTGSRGRLRTPVGIWVPFVITDVEEGRRWTWRVAGVPATGHRVEPRPQGCRVVFEVPVVAAPYAIVCRVALDRIAALLGAEPDGPAGDG